MLKSVLTWLILTVLVVGQVSALANAKAPCRHMNSAESSVETATKNKVSETSHHGHDMTHMSHVSDADSQHMKSEYDGSQMQYNSHHMQMECCQNTCDCQANSCHATSSFGIIEQLPVANIKTESERSFLSLSIPKPPFHQSTKPPIIA